MAIIDEMLAEFEMESVTTRTVLEAAPEEKYGYTPHEKSMSLGRLLGHIAENPSWVHAILNEAVFEVTAGGYQPYTATSKPDLLAFFDKNVAAATEAMRGASDACLQQHWKMTKAGQTVFEMPRLSVLRMMILNHNVHHRGQASVYLRLVGARVPSVYGPTADEPM